ncbi:MAG: hypothetical protein ACI37S_05695 [Candidatus Gastranaerophilaceae bacterium]
MTEENETKKCPFCGEEILATAKKCKHCGEWLEKSENNEHNSQQKVSIKYELPSCGGSCGCGCFIILAIIIGSFISILNTEPEFDENKPMQSCLQIGNFRGAKASPSKDDSVCKNNDIPEGCKKGMAPLVFTGGCINAFKEGSTMSPKYIEMLEDAIKMDENLIYFYGK